MFSFVRFSALIGILFFALVSFWPPMKKDHAGPAKVIDAVTLAINEETHRLYGVSPPPQRRAEATAALARFLDGRTVACQIRKTGEVSGRFVSVYYAGSDDIAAWVARSSWAIADRDANRLYNYTSDEGMARFLGKGLWDGRQ